MNVRANKSRRSQHNARYGRFTHSLLTYEIHVVSTEGDTRLLFPMYPFGADLKRTL